MTLSLQTCSGDPPAHRDFHTATAVGNMMVIFGGRSDQNTGAPFPVNNFGPDYYSNKVSFYDTVSSTWHSPMVQPPLPTGRRSHSAVSLSQGKLLIFGGFNG